VPQTPLGIIEGVLPPVLLAILLAILPVILRALAWYENIPRHSLISLSVYTRYFIFLIINGFLVVTFSSGLTAAIPKIVEDPTSTVSTLATQLPDAATFFLTYTITTGLSGAAGALLQVGSLLVFYLNRWLFGDTPRKAYKKTWIMPNTDMGVLLPRISLIASIALAYSIISPIINGLALLSFTLLWLAYKYLFTWVYDQPQAMETGGLYFPKGLSNLFVGLYIEQICLTCLFFLATDSRGRRSAIPQGVLMVVLIVITFAAQILFWQSFGPLINHLPTALSTKKIQDRFEKLNTGVPTKLIPDLFSREKVSALVRRKLKIESQQVNAEAIIAEEARNEEMKTEKKERHVRQNEADLGLLTAVMKTNQADAPTNPANGSASSSAGPSGAATASARPWSQPATVDTITKLFRRKSKDGGDQAHNQQDSRPDRPIQSAIPENLYAIEDSDSEDDDIEDNAFNHPSTYKNTPVIWIPKDDLGLSTQLLAELNAAGVYASDVGAFMDINGNVDVTRNPPDQEWIGGNDV